jgi:putative tricarboxylic transport membrane protein
MRELSLVPGIVRVLNMPGAGGAIAYAHAVARREGDENVLIAASPATTLRLAQGQFGKFTEEDVRWIGAIAADYGVVAVNPSSSWRTLGDLVRTWQADPSSLVVGGGSAAGGQDHMKMLVFARAIGIDPRSIRYVPFDGGGEAVTSLLGNFIQVFSGDASEIRGPVEAGGLRGLAVFAPERIGGLLRDVPTAKESGVDVEWVAWRGFYAPPGLTDESYRKWVTRLEAVAGSAEWARARAESGLAPFAATGPAFEEMVRAEVGRLRTLSRDLGLIE